MTTGSPASGSNGAPSVVVRADEFEEDLGRLTAGAESDRASPVMDVVIISFISLKISRVPGEPALGLAGSPAGSRQILPDRTGAIFRAS